MKGLDSISAAPSLGGVESLATLPIDTSHGSVSQEDRKVMEVTEDMVRLSVGIDRFMGKFIVIEGIDRSGKSTLASTLRMFITFTLKQ